MERAIRWTVIATMVAFLVFMVGAQLAYGQELPALPYGVGYTFMDDMVSPFEVYESVVAGCDYDSLMVVVFIPKFREKYYVLRVGFQGSEWRFIGDGAGPMESLILLEVDGVLFRLIDKSRRRTVSKYGVYESIVVTATDALMAIKPGSKVRIQYWRKPVTLSPEAVSNIARFVRESSDYVYGVKP